MGPRPQCYISRTKVIGPLVPEKIFEGFLPYMGVAAILVMWPRCPEQTFVPPTHGGSTWNLASIGQALLEKIFENGGQTDANGRRTDDGACLYYKRTNEPKGSGELKKTHKSNEPPHDKTNLACAPSEDSDQPGHSPSLISLRCPHEESFGP